MVTMSLTAQPTISESIDAILSSRPPATDHTTYLTILETHLRPELLPTLLEVLQDHELTEHIGWDLVGLLVPLLPASKACLEKVARWGNPREVILKVLEALREINFGNEDASSDDEEAVVDTSQKSTPPDGSLSRIETELEEDERLASPGVSRAVGQFQALLLLLGILHSRIKTQFPSRFVSSTLQAVLACYAEATPLLPWRLLDDIIQLIIQLAQTLSGKKRPPLPPRQSTQDVLVNPDSNPGREAEAELGNGGASIAKTPVAEDQAIQERLLQSFITHVLEEYFVSTRRDDDVPGMAWAARFQEAAHPDKIIPVKPSFGELFAGRAQLQSRERTVENLVSLARELKLNNSSLVTTIAEDPTSSDHEDEAEHPSSAVSIPLSRRGSLFVMVSILAAHHLSQSSSHHHPWPSFAIFPDHERIVQNFLGSNEHDMASIGREPAAVADAVVALGLWAYEYDQLGPIEQIDGDALNTYLQRLSLLSAHHPSPSIRAQSHKLASAILHSHPSDHIRYSIIHDTLEHCPFSNLQASAVEWFKEEVLEANRPSSYSIEHSPSTSSSIFTSPSTLRSIAPLLFPDLRNLVHISNLYHRKRQEQQPIDEELEDRHKEMIRVRLLTDLTFFMITLNLLYLLLSAPDLREKMNTSVLFSASSSHEQQPREKEQEQQENNDGIETRFLIPLRQAIDHQRREVQRNRSMDETELGEMNMSMNVNVNSTRDENGGEGEGEGEKQKQSKDQDHRTRMAKAGEELAREDLAIVHQLEMALDRIDEAKTRMTGLED